MGSMCRNILGRDLGGTTSSSQTSASCPGLGSALVIILHDTMGRICPLPWCMTYSRRVTTLHGAPETEARTASRCARWPSFARKRIGRHQFPGPFTRTQQLFDDQKDEVRSRWIARPRCMVRSTTCLQLADVVQLDAGCSISPTRSNRSSTTIFTFLMVFLIQKSQNSDCAAIQGQARDHLRQGWPHGIERRLRAS